MTLEAKNIKLFNEHAATVLALLYEAFPSPIDLHTIQLIDPEWKPGQPFEFDGKADDLDRAGDCLLWLHKHGFFDGSPVSAHSNGICGTP